ncbi:hypothetical protein OQX61_14915 [Pedobacter sp. PLR]|uniref:hypothetical protein n=1 Tax=Pedobacter sp. PLR TaxID=2994465 RepID=UPI0022474103|nr:hypothetical protein [Pedobacter sp. PLR]MCX2452566.1 hypothetical protein [Pedobacter sp. PLR]
MKITLDIKSLIIGFMASALIMMGLSFKNGEAENTGKYKTTIGEKGIVVLDTETGVFIISNGIYGTGRMDWTKVNFADAYETGREFKKKP